jgi:hypothetical protein
MANAGVLINQHETSHPGMAGKYGERADKRAVTDNDVRRDNCSGINDCGRRPSNRQRPVGQFLTIPVIPHGTVKSRALAQTAGGLLYGAQQRHPVQNIRLFASGIVAKAGHSQTRPPADPQNFASKTAGTDEDKRSGGRTVGRSDGWRVRISHRMPHAV